MTGEFKHYDGCNHHDPANCSACALTNLDQERPNYGAWPIAYMENHRAIPAQWRAAVRSEFRSPNKLYADNLRKTMQQHGLRFTDNKPLED